MFPVQKSYKVSFEPIFKNRLKGWDPSKKLNCDSSLTINLNTCHKVKTSWNMHITEMFYILYMMISQKNYHICVKKIVIYSCSGVFVLSLVSPAISQVRQNVAFTWLYTRRKASFFHATFTTISLLSLQQILLLLWLSLSNTGHYQHPFTTNNAAGLAEHIPSASFKAATPWGGHGDFAP